MNAKKEAKAIDRLKDSGKEFDGLTQVQAQVANSPRAVFSLRLASSELQEIASAAQKQGVPVGDFVRSAALAVSRAGELEIQGNAKLFAFYDALSQLQEASKALVDQGIAIRDTRRGRNQRYLIKQVETPLRTEPERRSSRSTA